MLAITFEPSWFHNRRHALAVLLRSWANLLFIVWATTQGATGLQAQRQAAPRAPAASASTKEPVAFDNVEEVVAKWSADQQLYVHGNIGVGARQLADLQRWLKEHGPHWTVVLMERADDQSFIAQDGRSYSGMDAVEYALGYGLNNRTDFGKLENPVTHETDGTVFVLFLRERKFSYYASEAQDRRNLGQAHWIGELDQPAFRAMRSGGRILDAVKDTVESINRKLEQRIQAEQVAQRRQAEERQRDLAETQGLIRQLRDSIAAVERGAAEFQAQHKNASDELAKPPLARWQQAVDAAEKELSGDNARSLKQKLSSITDETSLHLNAYAAAAGFEEHVALADRRIGRLRNSDSPAARRLADETTQLIAEARQQQERGEPRFTELLPKIDQRLAQGDAAIEQARRDQELAELRRMWIRRTALITLGGVGLIVVGLLALANRRRRATMLKAQQELKEREASTAREIERLDRLFTRNYELLGSLEKIDQRGYVGATRELAIKAFHSVDDLLVMSKEVKRVLGDARRLVAPKDPLNQLINLFSPGLYQRAINHVTGKPLRFSRATGIPLIIRELKRSNGGQGEAEASDQAVSLTFEEIFQMFQQRGAEAEQALTTLETCLTNVQDQLTQAQHDLEQATAQEKQLDRAAKEDGYFDVPHYFDTLIPAIQTNLREADDLAAFDAVHAVQGPLTVAQRQLADAQALGRQLLTARAELFPKLHESVDALKKLGYASDWIGHDLEAIGAGADQLYQMATTSEISGDSDKIADALAVLGQRAARSVELAKQIGEVLAPALAELGERVATTRQAVGQQLHLAPEATLREVDRDPDDCLARAQSSLAAAKAMLLQGREEAVKAAIATAQTEAQRAEEIIKVTTASVEAFAAKRQAIAETARQQQSRYPELSSAIEQARKAYAATALLIGQSLPGGPDETGEAASSSNGREVRQRAVDTLLERAEAGVADAEQLLSSADQQHQSGQVLAAAEALSKAEAILSAASGKLQQVAEHLE
ncbi:MAG: hypothetical protein ACTHOU_20500, partial [Aureliella sp.]